MAAKSRSLVARFIESIHDMWVSWDKPNAVWFRGESDKPGCHGEKEEELLELRPRVFHYDSSQEDYLVQSFRRKAGGLANMPPFERTDLWLFRAQHYNVPTRLLDWSEGALFALFFAINEKRNNPRVHMLNPHRLNALACDELLELQKSDEQSFVKILGLKPENGDEGKTLHAFTSDTITMLQELKQEARSFPRTWRGQGKSAIGYVNIAPAWEKRGEKSGRTGIQTPVAIPATYQDTRMIAQRSCFTVHGSRSEPMMDIVTARSNGHPEHYLQKFSIDSNTREVILAELSMLGIMHASIFPDLDRLGFDLQAEVGRMGNSGSDIQTPLS